MHYTKQQLVFFFLFFSSLGFAQFPVDTNYQTIPFTRPSLPSINNYIVDTSVPDPIKISRITEFNTNWNWYPIHEYAKIQPWNANQTIYKFYSVAIYNADTHQIIREIPGGQLYPTYWSNVNPDKIWGFQKEGFIRSYSIANNTISNLDQIQGYEFVRLGPGEGNIDKNDHYVAFTCKNGMDMEVVIYDLQNLQTNIIQNFPGAWGNGDKDNLEFVDWVSVSQSGNYVGIMWNHNTTSQANPFNGHFGVEIYDRQTMQFLRRITSYGNHGDFGYDQNGEEVFVQFWGETGTVNMFYLNRMERVVLSNNLDFNVEGHISCRNLNRPGWAYISQDDPEETGVIVAMKLDSSGIVEYFGHHFSTASVYNESPMPCPTPNGDKIMFKSDWGNTANHTEIYVFEATKASNLSQFETQNSNKFIELVI